MRVWHALQMRRERVVVDLAAGDDGRLFVEQVDQAARDARLGLAALAEEDDVLPGEDGVLDLRDDRLFVADDAGEELFARRASCASGSGASPALTGSTW